MTPTARRGMTPRHVAISQAIMTGVVIVTVGTGKTMAKAMAEARETTAPIAPSEGLATLTPGGITE